MTATVSVALCTYNGERFIAAQLLSILNQTVYPAEIVVCDDGSSDSTLSIVEAVAHSAKDLGISVRIVRSEGRLGVAANFERAVRQCSGDFIALCDQDDEWMPDRIERAVERFAGDDSLLLTNSNAQLVDHAGKILPSTLFEALGVSATDRKRLLVNPFAVLIRRNLVTGATVLFHRRLLQDALPFPASFLHDEWLALIAAAKSSFSTLDVPLISYRQHGGNEIGVAQRTLHYRLKRMFEPRIDRYTALASRAADLLERLKSIGAPDAVIEVAQRKLDFEEIRAKYPDSRFLRIFPVVRSWRRGRYRELSSMGSLDVVRDLVQRAR